MSTFLVQDLTLACLFSAADSLGSSSGAFSLRFLVNLSGKMVIRFCDSSEEERDESCGEPDMPLADGPDPPPGLSSSSSDDRVKITGENINPGKKSDSQGNAIMLASNLFTSLIARWIMHLTHNWESPARLPSLNMPPKHPATSPAMSLVTEKTRKSLTLEVKLDIIHRHEAKKLIALLATMA
ncbi:hypothetical protein E2C01_008558 [Portunus trituberculatus]|uniref:Uncharacterized protein n=1 Tax=Portunus trituberculatus TaxID=210409 RepID=A0A5B7D496_PORTR|nr:hypothetical protein [Portunus trituberculatus]